MAGVPDSAFNYLHRSGVIKNVSKAQEAASKPKVAKKVIAVQRPPEMNTSHVTKQGPREGHPAAKMRAMGEGWKPSSKKRAGRPETLGGATNSPGGNKARAAGAAKGVETKSASSDKNTHAAKRSTPDKAKLLAGHGKGGESAKYEKMEKRSLRGLKGGGTEKELREGHNLVMTTSGPIAPRPGGGAPSGGGTGGGGGGGTQGGPQQGYRGPGQIGSRVGMPGPPVGSRGSRRRGGRRMRAPRAEGIHPV
jgi:hypothetical protein